MRKPRRFKIVLLGEGRVGKTSILCRYTRGMYDDNSASTLQATFLQKHLVVDGQVQHTHTLCIILRGVLTVHFGTFEKGASSHVVYSVLRGKFCAFCWYNCYFVAQLLI